MIHLYRHRNYRDQTYAIICKKERIREDSEATTVYQTVTCPKCLDILIPIMETKLQRMKDNRALDLSELTRSHSSNEERPLQF